MATVSASALVDRAGREAPLQEAWNFLGPFLPELDISRDIVIRRGMPAFHVQQETCKPHALEKAASARPGVITIHPKRYDLETAAGLALVGHELVHQQQFQEDPRALQKYAIEQRRVDRANLPPWENRYERPAYELEAEIYRAALAAGYPKGTHEPLLISEGMAGMGSMEEMEALEPEELGWRFFLGTMFITSLGVSVIRGAAERQRYTRRAA